MGRVALLLWIVSMGGGAKSSCGLVSQWALTLCLLLLRLNLSNMIAAVNPLSVHC